MIIYTGMNWAKAPNGTYICPEGMYHPSDQYIMGKAAAGGALHKWLDMDTEPESIFTNSECLIHGISWGLSRGIGDPKSFTVIDLETGKHIPFDEEGYLTEEIRHFSDHNSKVLREWMRMEEEEKEVKS